MRLTTTGRVARPHSHFRFRTLLAFGCAGLPLVGGCGGTGSPSTLDPGNTQTPGLASISIAPATSTIGLRDTLRFKAAGRDQRGDSVVVAVSWTATGGRITPGGAFVSDSAGDFAVVAQQSGGTLRSDSARVQVVTSAQPPAPPPPAPPPPSPPTAARIDTIFREDFESGTLGQWQDGVNPSIHNVRTNAAAARSGSRYLDITYPAGGTGGWLSRWFMPGYDSIYVRYYVKFDPAWISGTKLLRLGGSRTDDKWSSFNQAGHCPDGYQWFLTNVVVLPTNGDPGPLRFYTYYPGMAREADGVTCWGRYGTGVATYFASGPVTRGTWHKLEFWVKLNAPGKTDGVQRYWLDDVEQAEWLNAELRKSSILKLNSLTLEASLTGDGAAPVSVVRHLYVDDILVTTARPTN